MNCKQLENLLAELDELLFLNQRLQAELDAMEGKAKAEYPEIELLSIAKSDRYVLQFRGEGLTKHQAHAVKRAYDWMVKVGETKWGAHILPEDARRLLAGE